MTGASFFSAVGLWGEDRAYNCVNSGIPGVIYFCNTSKDVFFMSNDYGFNGSSPNYGTMARKYMECSSYHCSTNIVKNTQYDFNIRDRIVVEKILSSYDKNESSKNEIHKNQQLITILEFDTFVSVNQNF